MVYPATQTALVGSVIGGDPKNMSIAVVNDELPEWREVCREELSNTSCYVGHYSCRFLNRLENDNLKLVGNRSTNFLLLIRPTSKLNGGGSELNGVYNLNLLFALVPSYHFQPWSQPWRQHIPVNCTEYLRYHPIIHSI